MSPSTRGIKWGILTEGPWGIEKMGTFRFVPGPLKGSESARKGVAGFGERERPRFLKTGEDRGRRVLGKKETTRDSRLWTN